MENYLESNISQIIKTALSIVFTCACIDNKLIKCYPIFYCFWANPRLCTTNLNNELCLISIQPKHNIVIHLYFNLWYTLLYIRHFAVCRCHQHTNSVLVQNEFNIQAAQNWAGTEIVEHQHSPLAYYRVPLMCILVVGYR